jgi:AraC-like DNA-binding protein
MKRISHDKGDYSIGPSAGSAGRASGANGGSPDNPLGLFRRESLSTGPAGTVGNLFADLRHVSRGEIIAEHPERNLLGTRLRIEQTEGHGSSELYLLGQGLYVIAVDGVYDSTRVERAPGEGFFEIHLRVKGSLEMALPGEPKPVIVVGPSLLLQYQPPGVDVVERVAARQREACVAVFCKPQVLAEFARRNGIKRWGLLEEIARHPPDRVWHRQVELSPTLLYIATSLLESPYRRGVRLLHAEAKALEILCVMLAIAQEEEPSGGAITSESDARRLEAARGMLTNSLSTPLRITEVARAIGMSRSKLKRAFKARFGVTIFDYSMECRMRHALELLRCKRLPVSQVAFAVGYRHQTSFATAFRDFFGFLPSKARTEMH